MSEQQTMREALAALGQPGDLAATVSASAPDARPRRRKAPGQATPKRRRWLKVLVIAGVVAVLAGAAYWQREPLLDLVETIPLVGSFVREQRQANDRQAPTDPRWAALEERERQLDERALLLDQVETELDQRLRVLSAQQEALSAWEAELEAREAALEEMLPGPGIDELVDIYRNMKPDAAADRIARLDEITAITILQRVDRQLAARILAAMAPDRAADLSEALANQGIDP